MPSNFSTRIASPASSIDDDDDCSDIPPWEMFDTECNVENEYCESRASSNPPSNGSDNIIPAMPCTQVKRAVLKKSVLDPCESI
eukprot:10579642-Heterocapsa_arctica.AAC.1